MIFIFIMIDLLLVLQSYFEEGGGYNIVTSTLNDRF